MEMESRTTLSLPLIFIILNILFFTAISASSATCTPSPTPNHNPTPNPNHKSKPKPTPTPTPTPNTPKCPRDALKLGVCANVLNGLLNVTLGKPPVEPCCTLIKGLADVEAAACLCTALKANLLGNNLNIPISLTLLLNVCTKKVPPGFQC